MLLGILSMLLFSSLTPTAIDYNPNVSATMQQPHQWYMQSTKHTTFQKTQKKHSCSLQSFGGKLKEIALARTSGVRGGACNEQGRGFHAPDSEGGADSGCAMPPAHIVDAGVGWSR